MLVPHHEFRVRRAVRLAAIKDPAIRYLVAGMIFIAVSRGTVAIDGRQMRYRPEWVMAQDDKTLVRRIGLALWSLLPLHERTL